MPTIFDLSGEIIALCVRALPVVGPPIVLWSATCRLYHNGLKPAVEDVYTFYKYERTGVRYADLELRPDQIPRLMDEPWVREAVMGFYIYVVRIAKENLTEEERKLLLCMETESNTSWISGSIACLTVEFSYCDTLTLMAQSEALEAQMAAACFMRKLHEIFDTLMEGEAPFQSNPWKPRTSPLTIIELGAEFHHAYQTWKRAVDLECDQTQQAEEKEERKEAVRVLHNHSVLLARSLRQIGSRLSIYSHHIVCAKILQGNMREKLFKYGVQDELTRLDAAIALDAQEYQPQPDNLEYPMQLLHALLDAHGWL